jgi:hypothetical protein
MLLRTLLSKHPPGWNWTLHKISSQQRRVSYLCNMYNKSVSKYILCHCELLAKQSQGIAIASLRARNDIMMFISADIISLKLHINPNGC